ncbi:Ede1 protein [Pichia kluyveri]|uniref:Ede1 protein n=1 Tax=Pichia kluyveri TaxID=36015 RepID=A0AAV5R7I7_PICKL|nr:Ede1 protein [Pichia kluyveri]
MSESDTLIDPLTIEEKKFYGSIFKSFDLEKNGLISGLNIKPLLESSNLSLIKLGEIWNIVDYSNLGYLNQFQFCLLMRLISYVQNGGLDISIENSKKLQPLAKFNNIVPAPPPTTTSIEIIPVLTPTQATKFGQMFDKTAINGILNGNDAKNIFLKAKLPINILEKIWNLVDQNQIGNLNKSQFIIAMHLIQCFINNSINNLPNKLSPELWKVAQNVESLNPLPSSPLPSPSINSNLDTTSTTNLNTWIMSNQQKQQYGSIFKTLDINNENLISSKTVANFLITSNLSNSILANIWELSNINDNDFFTIQEFSIAMYLVQKKLAGYELPLETPIELIKSSSFDNNNNNNNNNVTKPTIPSTQQKSFNTVKDQAAPQRTPSHMDDLLGIFKSADQVAPSPLPPVTTPGFTPNSNFGRELQTTEEDDSSSDDDEGPENLDLPKIRGNVNNINNNVPIIPGRDVKPNFTGNNNYDVIKNVNPIESSMFTNQPVSGVTSGVTSGVSSLTAGAIGAASGLAAGAIGSTIGSTIGGAIRSNNNDTAQASIDIANYSNQMNSLSKQTSILSNKKDKSQNDLNKIFKARDDILNKLNQMKKLYENESKQVIEIENLIIKENEQNDELLKNLNIIETNLRAEQTKKDSLNKELNEIQLKNTNFKEKLNIFNNEKLEIDNEINELNDKLIKSKNYLAIIEQQVLTQENTNNELKLKIEEINNNIFQIDNKHENLLNKLNQLNDEQMNLHELQTDLSINHADKTVNYSHLLSNAASKGILGDEVEDEEEEHIVDGEIPTASLDDFDDEDLAEASEEKEGNEEEKEVEPTPLNTENNNESFEFVNHPSTSTNLNFEQQRQSSQPISEVETLSDTPNKSTIEQTDEFPPIKELEPLNDSSSEEEEEEEEFKDAVPPISDSPTPSPIPSTSKNPFGSKSHEENINEIPQHKETGPSMFDDLDLDSELEDATIEQDNEPISDNNNNNNISNNHGFSFIENNPSNDTPTTEGDDWEQVFAGFGNDPNLQPAKEEEEEEESKSVPEVHNDNNELSNSQELAIEELTDMGFTEEESILALRLKNWSIEDASNYLLEKS